MDDLIRRYDVLKLLDDIAYDRTIPKNFGLMLDIIRKVENIPSAYDADKAVEQLDKFMRKHLHKNENYDEQNQCWPDCASAYEDGESVGKYIAYRHAVGIVKKGGVE